MHKFYRYATPPAAAATAASNAFARRGLLIAASSGGLTLALLPPGLVVADPAGALSDGSFQPTIWYEIRQDGRILVNIAEAEMGQHVGTALARIVADELEAEAGDDIGGRLDNGLLI